MGMAAVAQLDGNARDGGAGNENDAARLGGVGVLQGGQDFLDGDTVRHLELAGEAGLVGVQDEPSFLGKDDELDGLLAALGTSHGGVEEGGHRVAGGDHAYAVEAGGGGGEAEAYDEGDDGHDDDHLDEGDSSGGTAEGRTRRSMTHTGMLIHRRDAEAQRQAQRRQWGMGRGGECEAFDLTRRRVRASLGWAS